MTRTKPQAAPVSGVTASLAALANELAALLERETSLVRAMRIAEIEPLQPDKTGLTQRFEANFREYEPFVGSEIKEVAIRPAA